MKKKIVLGMVIIAIAFSIVYVCYINPHRDTMVVDDFPTEYMSNGQDNYIDYQTGNECASCSIAFVLRYRNVQVHSSQIEKEIGRFWGFVSYRDIVKVFENHGVSTDAYSGSMEQLKYRVSQGNPVIVFTQIPNDTHYMVMVGYDSSYLYFADSMGENSDIESDVYNRKLTYDEFAKIWKTNSFMKNNIYICVI